MVLEVRRFGRELVDVRSQNTTNVGVRAHYHHFHGAWGFGITVAAGTKEEY